MTAYAPLGSPGRPKMFQKPGEVPLLENETIEEIANKHAKSKAQVLLRWAYQRNVVVIPKSTTASRIEENFDIFDFELDNTDMNALLGLEEGNRYRYCDWAHMKDHSKFNPFVDNYNE